MRLKPVFLVLLAVLVLNLAGAPQGAKGKEEKEEKAGKEPQPWGRITIHATQVAARSFSQVPQHCPGQHSMF